MADRTTKRFGPMVRRPNLGSNAPKKPKPAAAKAWADGAEARAHAAAVERARRVTTI
jgi:hypothetical protein